MTEDKERRSGVEFEKSPWKSKKFAFAMIQVILWKAIILTALILFAIYGQVTVIACIVLCLLILTPGVIESLYIGGQKALDQYVRIAALTAGQITDGGKDLLNKIDNAMGLDLIKDEPEDDGPEDDGPEDDGPEDDGPEDDGPEDEIEDDEPLGEGEPEDNKPPKEQSKA